MTDHHQIRSLMADKLNDELDLRYGTDLYNDNFIRYTHPLPMNVNFRGNLYLDYDLSSLLFRSRLANSNCARPSIVLHDQLLCCFKR